MKNLCAAVTALMLMLLILVAREPKPAFTSEECILLLKSVADVDNWHSGKSPIKSVKGVVDGNSGVITLKVYVDETFKDSNFAELENDIKHDYLMALVENFEPDALMKMTVTEIEVNTVQ